MKKRIIFGFFCINLIVVLGVWLNGSGGIIFDRPLVAFGRLSGLIGAFFILAQLLLISRLPIIEKVFGFDNLNRWHRINGYALAVGLFAHPILLVVGYAKVSGVSLADQFLSFLTSWEHVFLALIGLVLLWGTALLSIPAVKKKLKYETWHLSHLFMYIAIGLAFGHQIASGDTSQGFGYYYWLALHIFVFGSVVLFRFIRPVYLYNRHKFYVDRIVKENADIYSVYISGRNMESFVFEAGQYVSVSFLKSKIWQPHPFSISSVYNGRQIRLTIKMVGDYTKNIANLKVGTKVVIEGPFGRFIANEALGPKYLFIAGGVGITPIRAMLEVLAKRGRDTVLLYGSKKQNEVVFGSDLKKMAGRYVNIFSQENISGAEFGRIDEEKIKRLVPDYLSRDVYVCGPLPMIDSVISALLHISLDRKRIHFEKFSY